MASEADQELIKLIQEFREQNQTAIDWRQRYFALRDELDDLQLTNQQLRAQLERPAGEEIERLKSEVAAMNMKCAALMDALETAKVRRKSSSSLS